MNSGLEVVIVGVAIAVACVFIGVKLVSTLRGRSPSCCSGGGREPKACACGGCPGHGPDGSGKEVR